MPRRFVLTQERVSEVDLTSAIYPLSIQRRIERRWAERINSLRQIHSQIVAGSKRSSERIFNNADAVNPVPVRTIADRRQLDLSLISPLRRFMPTTFCFRSSDNRSILMVSKRHSVGDNSSNFFSAASYTLTWSIGNSALRSLALFCAA